MVVYWQDIIFMSGIQLLLVFADTVVDDNSSCMENKRIFIPVI